MRLWSNSFGSPCLPLQTNGRARPTSPRCISKPSGPTLLHSMQVVTVWVVMAIAVEVVLGMEVTAGVAMALAMWQLV